MLQSPQLPGVEAALTALPALCACGDGHFLTRRMTTQMWPLCLQLLRCRKSYPESLSLHTSSCRGH